MGNFWKENKRRIQTGKTMMEVYGSPDCPARFLDEAIAPVLSAWTTKSDNVIDVCAWDGSLTRAVEEHGLANSGACNNFLLGSQRVAEANMLAAGGRWQQALTFGAKKSQEQNFDCAVFRIPHWLGNKAITGLIQAAAVALRPGGRFMLAGQKKRGVRSHEEWASRLFGQPTDVQKAGHFRVSTYCRPETREMPLHSLEPMQLIIGEVEIEGKGLKIARHPAVYSAGKLDAMTRLLIQSLPSRCDQALDLGSGTGIVAAWMGRYGGARNVVALDANVIATACTDMTLKLNGLSGAAIARTNYFGEGLPDASFELIACYPPFHVGPKVEHVVAMRMISEAFRLVSMDGAFHIAMSSAQSYVDKLNYFFADVRVVIESGNQRILRCMKPRQLHYLG